MHSQTQHVYVAKPGKKMNVSEIKTELENRRRGLEKRLAMIDSDLGQELDRDSADRAIVTENDEVLIG